MTRKLFIFSVSAVAAFLVAQTHAQISVTTGAGLTYNQDFDTLTRSTTAENWTDNVATPSSFDSPQVIGLAGWYAGNFGTTTVTPQIRASTGSSTAGNFYSFGNSPASDRALGTLPLDTTASASMRVAARFVNNTGDLLTGFTFSYDGEQWRASSAVNVNNQYVVAYAVFPANSGSLNSILYSANIASAALNTPNDGNGTAVTLDGNLAGNRVAGLSGTISELSVLPGEEVWLRWFDSNSSGADHSIAIDNFTVTFTTAPVPEPSTTMLVSMGLALLTWRVSRRR